MFARKKVLSICSRTIDSNDLQEITQELHTYDYIKLRDCGLTDAGIPILAKTLCSNNALTKLDLSNNFFTACGAISLFSALKHHQKLEYLDLRYNVIRTSILVELGALLTTNTSLRRIDISRNSFSSSLDDCNKFIAVLQKNFSLIEFRSSLNDSMQIIIKKYLARNQALQKMMPDFSPAEIAAWQEHYAQLIAMSQATRLSPLFQSLPPEIVNIIAELLVQLDYVNATRLMDKARNSDQNRTSMPAFFPAAPVSNQYSSETKSMVRKLL